MGILFTDENEGDGKYTRRAAASKLVLSESKEAATCEVKAKSVSILVENDPLGSYSLTHVISLEMK
jgi:hypothetical protein